MIKIDKDEYELKGNLDDIMAEVLHSILIVKELIGNKKDIMAVFNDELLCCVQASNKEEFVLHQFVNPRVINMIIDEIGGMKNEKFNGRKQKTKRKNR